MLSLETLETNTDASNNKKLVVARVDTMNAKKGEKKNLEHDNLL